MLIDRRKNMRRPIQQGLLTVAVLGVLTAGLAVVALNRTVTGIQSLRLSHARESSAEELGRLGTATGDDAPPPNIIGMRGNVVRQPADIAGSVPAAWSAALVALAGRARAEDAALYEDVPVPDGHLVERAMPTPDGRIAWVAYRIGPSPYLQSWRVLVVALTISAMLLVASAVMSLVTFKRGASALLGATRALANDLTAHVPRPPVSELADIGDGIAALARNLVEARQEQERLARDLSRQERLAALGRVVAGVAHEVRNPLASIKLRLDLAASSPVTGGAAPLPPAVTGAIAHASAEIARLDGLVADLLTVSGRALGPRAPLDLAQLARRRADALAPWAALRGVTMHVSDAPSGPAVATGDADRLARAVDNLLRNAVEASPGGDVVAVEVSTDRDHVHLRVLDRGAGIPLGQSGALFEPFFTTKSDGTGLGLAISRAIAQAHGGEVAYARDGDVTRFELTLPRETGRAVALPAEARA